MSKKFRDLIPGVLLLAGTIFPMVLANAQAVSLQEQLAAQYKLVKMGSDTSGYSVVEEGTRLGVTKGIGFGMKKFGKEQTTKLFAKGDKVYATKIDVSLDKDQVTMGIVACDKCNKLDPPPYNKTNIIFVFPKGSLATASAGQVEDTIGTLLSISSDDAKQSDDSGQQQGGDQHQGGDKGPQNKGGQQPAAQDQAPQAEPQSIDKGMTLDQVQAAMGKPDKIVNLGAKQIYVYKDLKVTFLNGKVSDVQ